MSEQDQDKSKKTEEPSLKKLEDARKKGETFVSKELSSFMSLCTFTLLLSWLTTFIIQHILLIFQDYMHDLVDIADTSMILHIVKNTFFKAILVGFIPVIILWLVSIINPILQHGFMYSPDVLLPKLSRISPLAGFRRIFSFRSLFELIKGCFKIGLMGAAIYFSIKPAMPHIGASYGTSTIDAMNLMMEVIKSTMMTVCVIMFFVGTIDYMYQRYQFMSNMRMTKEEVKREHKEREGSPEIKAKVRSLRARYLKSRMMAMIPQADVVITNPDHYAVALEYDIDSMDAPRVIAKGQDDIALEIKRVAKEHNVEIIRDPLLARSLYNTVEIGKFIRTEHYKAVAAVIHKILKFQNKLLQMSKNGSTKTESDFYDMGEKKK